MNAFDKVIGYEAIKSELLRLCDVLKNPDKYKKLGVTAPSGVLLYGAPGLGKSLMAMCFIEESGLKSYIIRKDKPDGTFIDAIKQTYTEAKEHAPAIVFLDDMDKFANEDEFHPYAQEYVTIQACIDECKAAEVFSIATVNHTDSLPDSLLRAGRFDKVIAVEYPAFWDAKKIIEHYLNEKQLSDSIDVEELARLLENHSCAELENVINDAGMYAGSDNRDRIEYEDLKRACIRRLFDGPETDRPQRGEMEDVIAYHEAGHVVVAEMTEPGSVNLVTTIDYYGENGGLMRVHDDSYGYRSRKQIEHDIMRDLGGKASVEVVFGIEDVGCSSDMSSAYHNMARMIDDSCVKGFDSFIYHDAAEFTKENRDRLVAAELERCYRETKRILIEHRDFLDAVHDELMAKRLLTFRDIERIRVSIESSSPAEVTEFSEVDKKLQAS